MVLKTFDSTGFEKIEVKPLTREGFAKFGSIVSPDEEVASKNNDHSNANYGTAIKITKVSSAVNNFKDCKSKKQAELNLNIFRCFPPVPLMTQVENGFTYLGKVLERHPYSTQTFTPMGRSSKDIGYIVVVALSDKETGLPDSDTIELFYCTGNQAVTYGAGCWHAPMIAFLKHKFENYSETVSTEEKSKDYIDFQVLIFENDVADEDCQECMFDPGYVLHFQYS